MSKHFTSLFLLLTQVFIAVGKTLSQGFACIFHFPPANWEEGYSATFAKGFRNSARRVLFRHQMSVLAGEGLALLLQHSLRTQLPDVLRLHVCLS